MFKLHSSVAVPTARAVSRLTSHSLSTHPADTLPAMSRNYLTKWLGKDMAGSSYNERIVNASKASSVSESTASFEGVGNESQQQQGKQQLVNAVEPQLVTDAQIILSAPSSSSSPSKNSDAEGVGYQEAAEAAPAAVAAHVPAMIYHGTVRSGQQIYADGRSLVIVGSVNNGAEVLSDGDIHVYGSLLGRAVAGLGGCSEAHIFARSFGASLVGISDAFIAPDDCSNLQGVEGKESFVRMLRKDESSADLRGTGAVIVDCGSGNSLVLTPM